jgi:signal transduction histidine kinase
MQLESKKEIIILFIAGITICFVMLAYIINFLFLYQKRKKILVKESEDLKLEFEQQLLLSQLEIKEQTLQHISQELHDNLGQVASLIKINLNTLSLQDTEKATAKIEHTKEITRQLITDIKALSVSLGADRIAQTGLVKALEIEVDRLNKTDAFEASFSQQGSIPELGQDKSVILYRMAQEILNNMVKHSGATHFDISVKGSENLFILEFNDDGEGFDVTTKKQSGGAGLRNLENRARLINALLIMESKPGKGSRVRIELPI